MNKASIFKSSDISIVILMTFVSCLIPPTQSNAQISIIPPVPTITSATWDGKGVVVIQWSEYPAVSSFYQIRWQKGPDVTASATQSRDTGFNSVNNVNYGSFQLLESEPGPYTFIVQGCDPKQFAYSTTCSDWSTPVTVTIPQPSPSVQSVSFTWNNLAEGDCRMQSGSVIFRSDGSALFTGRVKTDPTHSGDIWHSDILGLTSSDKIIVDLGSIDSPTMSDDHGWYDWRHTFTYNAGSYQDIKAARMHSSC